MMDPPPPVDLLSSLPVHLQDEILTRLDLRDAVHTSAISRAWRRRWETIPRLALSFPDGTPPSAIDRVLRRYAGSSVSHFACHADTTASDSHVDDWVIALSRRSVESISIIKKLGGRPVDLQSSIFSCNRLVSLTLEHCCIPLLPQPWLQPGFPVLKELYLSYITFAIGDKESHQLQAMIQASPMLRVLFLEEVYPSITDRVIEAPNLHTLGLVSPYVDYWRFGELPRLKYAYIDGPPRHKGGPADFLKFLAGVSHVEDLSFKLPRCDFQMDAIPFTFSNLKSLELSSDFDDMRRLSLMFCLLRSSPNLEKLKIEVPWSDYRTDVNHVFLNEQWTDGMFANLQVVEITSYKGCLPLSFIEFILSKASLLRTLSVDACPASQDDQLNELLKCRRASPKAQVLFKVQLEKISFDRMKLQEKDSTMELA